MFAVQIFEQDILVSFFSFVLRDVIPPTADGGGKATGNIGLLTDLNDRMEIGTNCEDDAAGAGESGVC